MSKTAAAAFLDSRNESYLSAASAWEIAISIETLSIDEESALHTSRLPNLHVTPDELIAQYAVRVLW